MMISKVVQIQHPYINLAVVCPSVRLSVRPFVRPSVCPLRFVTFFQWIMARPNQVKTSPNLQHIESLVSQAVLNCLSQSMCLCACTAREIVHAIFAYFFGHFFDILKPFLTENEKTEAAFQIGIDKAQTI